MNTFDVVVHDGLLFDGTGAAPLKRDVGILNGRVTAISETRLDDEGARSIDAAGRWVTPGFIDLHTHYDAEVELSPGLNESIRHGVTTVTLGSCSLSLAVGSPEDLADQFARVEAIPYPAVRALLENAKSWSTHAEYRAHLDSLPLGPNVTSYVGHSAIRAAVMGMERSVTRGENPTEAELKKMESVMLEGLDAGFLGLSVQTLSWDKVGGDRDIRSRPLPSTFAKWSEYHRLTRTLRARGRIFQGVPNVSTKWNVILFLLESVGLWRKALKTTVISMMDTRATRGLHTLIGLISRTFNALGADFRWQALPEKFDLFSDGIDLVVFEEFGAGAAALHLEDQAERSKLLSDPTYRAWFKKQWKSKFLPKVFHRDFNHSLVLDAPDASLIGKSFAALAKERNEDVSETFLSLVAEHGRALRWYTVMANDRTQQLEEIASHPDVLIGFSDAGAHLRNMAHYNFPLRLLKLQRDSQLRGEPCMTPERAVHRVTGEIADWLGIDAGKIAVGSRADLVVLDPEKLGPLLDTAEETPMPFFDNLRRLTNQNGGAVQSVLVNGREAVRDGALTAELGHARGFGQFLNAVQLAG